MEIKNNKLWNIPIWDGMRNGEFKGYFYLYKDFQEFAKNWRKSRSADQQVKKIIKMQNLK